MQRVTASQRRVLDALREPRRAHDLAAELSIDASAVRRHLDNLVSQGLVTASDVRGGPGRPKRFYQATAAGRELGPRNYPLLLAKLMRQVSEGEGRRKLLRYLEAIAADLAGPPARHGGAKARLDLLLATYNRLGFQAELQTAGGETHLVQRNCPFLAAAEGDPPAFCQTLDEGILRSLLPGHDATLDMSQAHGDAYCRHRITARAQTTATKAGQRGPEI